MEIVEPTVEEMQARVARFGALTPSKQAFVDTRIPEYERDIYNVIGRGVTEDASLAAAIADARYFSITYVGAEPGKAKHDASALGHEGAGGLIADFGDVSAAGAGVDQHRLWLLIV